jgi:hypothetical protein
MSAPRKPPRRVLVSLLTTDRADIDLARRLIGYHRLVLLAHPAALPLAEAVRASEDGATRQASGAVHIERMPSGRVDAHVDAIRRILNEERAESGPATRFIFNAAGGDPGLVMAMLLVAYEDGHETWFTQEGHHVRLPVIAGLRLSDRLTGDEGAVLQGLPAAGMASALLAQHLLMPRDRIERAYRGLERKDLVRLYADAGMMAARPTHVGAYVRAHLENAP